MKLKNSYFFTLREDTKDEESLSGNLLVRSGMIKKVGAGIYMYLPMGLKVLDKIKKIVKEEMDKTGAQELLMPSLIPRDYYEASNRATFFGSDMFKLNDRFDKPFVLGPTHEELFTFAAKSMVKSYKDLPFTIYQQADKFRDEPRPRYGLIRVREFIMKDAYSFDSSEAGLDISYNKMKQAYNNIFDRLKINYKLVKSDTGAMGGSLSEEYQAITDIGEDVLVLCENCDYAANVEVAEKKLVTLTKEAKKEKELVLTKGLKTIEDVSNYLKIDIKKMLKAILLNVDNKLVVAFIRGDRELNLVKLTKLLQAKSIDLASDDFIKNNKVVAGFTGPISLNAKKVIDSEVLEMHNFCCGANKEDYHYLNVNVEDFKYDLVGDITNVCEGDCCPRCEGKLYFKKGIEIGNLFKLGTKYAEALDLTFLDQNNKEQVVTMGSYGIGIGRILASIVEQNHDANGLILPISIAPFEVEIVIIDSKDNDQVSYAEELYDDLQKRGIDVLLDDREERPGVKFKDADLIGIPLRITIGKKIVDGSIEVKKRLGEIEIISKDSIVEYTSEYIKNNKS